MSQPFLAVQCGGAVAFAAAVVLVDDRSPPVDHLPLDLHRAGCRRVHGALVAGQVVALALFGRQLEQAHEHGRHPLAMGDAVALDVRQGLALVELLHEYHGGAEVMHAQREAKGRGMV
ncbi:hypothetical protein D9M70_510330 [compost metagenome]